MAKTSNLACDVFSDTEEAARRHIYRRVTYMLIGIIIVFIVCRVGEFVISIYELSMMIKYGRRQEFSEYMRAIISINNFLHVCDSSLNFAIYCKDIFFRYGLLKLYHVLCGKNQTITIVPETLRMANI